MENQTQTPTTNTIYIHICIVLCIMNYTDMCFHVSTLYTIYNNEIVFGIFGENYYIWRWTCLPNDKINYLFSIKVNTSPRTSLVI